MINKLYPIVLFCILGFTSYAQQVRNVNFTVQNEEIHVTYDLLEIEDSGPFYVELFYSTDKGATWHGPVSKGIQGDLGNGVSIGNGKKVIWKPLASVLWLFSDYVMCKVVSLNSTFTDSRDGKVYKTVKIGEQVWMAENLNYKTSSGSWCYNGNSSNCNTYGRLYNWETAKTACPNGWHLPSESEFETLLNNYGGGGENAYNALIPGGSSGFSALLGGWRSYFDSFLGIGKYGSFWSSSPLDDEYAWTLDVSGYYENAKVDNDFTRGVWRSVRCLQD